MAKTGASSTGLPQQKRLQGRRQNRANPQVEGSKGRKQASAANRNEEIQLAKFAARQNLGLMQENCDSRQEHLIAHSEQTTFQSRQRKEKQTSLVLGNSMTTITGHRNSIDQIDTRLAKQQAAANQFQQVQISSITSNKMSALPATGSISLQKKPVSKGVEQKLTQKRQARTTHHSRQISWSRDQNSAEAMVGQSSIQNGHSLQQTANEQGASLESHNQVTAAQKAHQSQKSKMTQSILKRLKQNIDSSGHPQQQLNMGAGSTGQSSALPSQISDAYITQLSKKANSAATTMIAPADAPQTTKLSTILEQNSNLKLAKTFIAQKAEPEIVSRSKVTKARTSSMVNDTATPSQEIQSAFTVDGKLLQKKKHNAQRKPRSKDSALQQRQHRQSASPQTSQPVNLISSVRTSLDGQPAQAIAYQSHRYQPGSNMMVNPYLTQQEPQAFSTSDRQTPAEQLSRHQSKNSGAHSKLTQAQIEVLRQSFQSDSGISQGQVFVKKANIIADPTASMVAKSATTKSMAVKQQAQKTATHARGQDNVRINMLVPSLNAAQITTAAQQARFKSGPTSQTRSKNQVEQVLSQQQSSREVLHQNDQDKKVEAVKKVKQPQIESAGPNAAITFSFIKKQANPSSKASAAEARVPPRKAKTTYARTPASFRSTSGGKPSTQAVQMVVQAHPDGQGGGISVTNANSPDIFNSKQLHPASKQQNVVQRIQGTVAVAQMMSGHQIDLQAQAKGAKLSTHAKARQMQQQQLSRDQKFFQQAILVQKQQLPYNAQSFGSLNTKQSKQTKYSSKTHSKGAEQHPHRKQGKSVAKNVTSGGNHKRSVSFKSNQEAISLIQNTQVTQNQSSPLQGPGQQQINQKFRVNFDYDQLLNSKNMKPGSKQGTIQHSVVSPLRTKQPSINNSRKISKERDPSKQSVNSVTSPRPNGLQMFKAIPVNRQEPSVGCQSRQQSSFLTKANHKSFNSNQLASTNDQATSNSKEMQKILKKFFKDASKKVQGAEGAQNQQSLPKQLVLNTKATKLISTKTKPSSITSLSSKGKQQRTFNQLQMQNVLASRQSPAAAGAPSDDRDTLATGTVVGRSSCYIKQTFNNAQSAKDQRTFQQETKDLRRQSSKQHQKAHKSFSHVSKGGGKSTGGFAPEGKGQGSRGPCSAFMEHDIISGTYIATKSNDKMKVYPEEVKERLLSHMPQRTRINRVPTSQQLLANTFENQRTIKPGDQLNQPEEQIEQIKQISVLDESFKEEMKHSPRSENNSHKGGIFQAFNEYVSQQDARANGYRQTSKNTQESRQTARQGQSNQMPTRKQARGNEGTIIREFGGSQESPAASASAAAIRNGPLIDFHPSQPMLGEVSSPPAHGESESKYKSHQSARGVEKKPSDLVNECQGDDSSDYYDSELQSTEVFDPLLEDKQYLVTMIVTHFQEMGQPIATTHEFYRIGNQLGEGAFGKVVIAQHKLSGHFVAIKCMRKKDMNKQVECKKKVAQDLQILQHLTHHLNVVKLYDSFETRNHLCFVMELCAGGDLLSFVRRRKKLDEQMAKFIFKQAAKGLAYCHRHNVMHRDIKLENLLLDDEGMVKLCDFGVSQLLAGATDLIKDQCGTPAYMAPEVFACTKEFSGQQADVWSLGVCLFAMLCGMVPFKGRSVSELRNNIISSPLKYPVEEKSKLSKEARHLVKIMLRKDPDKRATLKQVLRHPWLNDAPKSMAIFSNSELKKIKQMSNPASGGDEQQRLLTEVELTSRSLTDSQKLNRKRQGSSYSLDYGQKVNNATGRSDVLAPFNSTITNEDFQQYFCDDIPIESAEVIKFSDKVREANRQYEFNYNDEVDNGIMISIGAAAEADEKSQARADKPKRDEAKRKKSKGASSKTELVVGMKAPQASVATDRSTHTAKRQLQQSSSQKVAISPPKNSRMTKGQKECGLVSLANGEEESDDEVIEARPVINFNGMVQVGYMVPPSKNETLVPSVSKKSVEGITQAGKNEPKASMATASDGSSEGSLKGEYKTYNMLIDQQMSVELSDDEEKIDNIIVCKIENEFGYPEEYLLECLKNNRKNDATTCYHLFCKEDKHEIVNLIQYSPKQKRVLT